MAKKIINAENDLMDFAYGEFVGRMKAYDIRERDVKRQEGELLVSGG